MYDEDIERIESLQKELAEMRETLDRIEQYLVKADQTISTIAAEVKPTIESLSSGPLGMFFGKKKK